MHLFSWIHLGFEICWGEYYEVHRCLWLRICGCLHELCIISKLHIGLLGTYYCMELDNMSWLRLHKNMCWAIGKMYLRLAKSRKWQAKKDIIIRFSSCNKFWDGYAGELNLNSVSHYAAHITIQQGCQNFMLWVNTFFFSFGLWLSILGFVSLLAGRWPYGLG